MQSAPILILVDDDAVDQEIFRRAFTAEAVAADLVLIGGGRDCAARIWELLAAKEPGRGALVMLDLNMPGENGFEVLASLRADAATRLLPVVVFTTSSDREDIARAYALGANSYVVKPANFTDLRRTLRVIADYWFGVALGSLTQGPRRAG